MEFYEKETNLFYIYYQLIKKYKLYMEKALDGFNLAPAEIDVLTFLINNEDKKITAKDISEIRGISKGLVSRAITSLKKKGIVKTIDNPDDKRSVFLQINNKESNLIDMVKEHNLYFINHVTDEIDVKDLKNFIEVHQKMLANSKKIDF